MRHIGYIYIYVYIYMFLFDFILPFHSISVFRVVSKLRATFLVVVVEYPTVCTTSCVFFKCQLVQTQ